MAKVLGVTIAFLGALFVSLGIVHVTVERNAYRKQLMLIKAGKMRPAGPALDNWYREGDAVTFESGQFNLRDCKSGCLRKAPLTIEELQQLASKKELVFRHIVQANETVETENGTYKCIKSKDRGDEWILSKST